MAQFSIRLDDDVIASLDALAAECGVKRANVIDWATVAYLQFAKANGNRSLTSTDMAQILDFIRTSAAGGSPKIHPLRRVAEEPHEPGKVINPAAAGGASTVPDTRYRTAGQRKSSS